MMTPILTMYRFSLWGPRKLLSELDSGEIMVSITQKDLIAPVGQRGFWDEQQRVTKLQDQNPVRKSLAESIP
jgi:hypothetical protein